MPVADAFFDTNVLLYLLSDDLKKAARAEEILAAGGVISVQVLNEFASAAIRKSSVSFVELREVLSAIRTFCEVKPVDIATHELALELADRYRFSIYDSLIVAAALRASCSVLYSEDLQHGQKIERMTIQNPFA